MVRPADPAFVSLARLARLCAVDGVGSPAWLALQEEAARAYRLDAAEWRRVRADFAWLPARPRRE
jgi:hypothetical protein